MHGRPHLVHPRAATNPIPGIVVAVIASAGANSDQTRLTHRSGAALVPLKNLRTPNSGQLGPVITAWYSLHRVKLKTWAFSKLGLFLTTWAAFL